MGKIWDWLIGRKKPSNIYRSEEQIYHKLDVDSSRLAKLADAKEYYQKRGMQVPPNIRNEMGAVEKKREMERLDLQSRRRH